MAEEKLPNWLKNVRIYHPIVRQLNLKGARIAFLNYIHCRRRWLANWQALV